MKRLSLSLPTWAWVVSLLSFGLALTLGVYLGQAPKRQFQAWTQTRPSFLPLIGTKIEDNLTQIDLGLGRDKPDLSQAELALKALLAKLGLSPTQRGHLRYQLSTVERNVAHRSKDVSLVFSKLTAALVGYHDALTWLKPEDPGWTQTQTAWAKTKLEWAALKQQAQAQEAQRLAQLGPEPLLKELQTSLGQRSVDRDEQKRRRLIIRLISQKTQDYPFFTSAPQ